MTICDGITVLELGSGSVAGSVAGMLLADAGARVLKVERPGGDPLRDWSPSGFLVWNRGKESLVLDMHTAAAANGLRDLAAWSDVVIDALGPSRADAWGIGADRLCAANERLVHCTISGFGRSGPLSGVKAYEGVIAAKSGLFTRPDVDFRPGPIFGSTPVASVGAGHMAAGGVLAALAARERTGRGARLDATLWQGLNPVDYFGVMHWQHARRAAVGGGGQGPGVVASRFMLTVCTRDDRWLVVMPHLPHQARAVVRCLGLEELERDERFAGAPIFASADDAQEWEDAIWTAFRTRDLPEWQDVLLADPDVAFEVAGTSEDGLEHPQILHNGNAMDVPDDALGPIRQVGPVAAFADTPIVVRGSAPALDHHGGLEAPPPRAVTAAASLAGGAASALPLAGVTILETGYFYAMPYGVTLAAALGARVIKVEGLSGDPMRWSYGAPETGGVKTMAGKESVAIDLATDEGRDIFHSLARRADAVVQSFRPGVAERLGIDHATLSKLNPRLVYVHAAGYGTSGPYSRRPIYALCASAIAGAIGRQAGEWLLPERSQGLSVAELQAIIAPRLKPLTDGDANGALGVFTSLLLGLYDQARTGRGQFLSTSMIGANALTYADDFVTYHGKRATPQMDADQLGLGALYRLYETAAGWVFLAAPSDGEWRATAAVLGMASLVDDPRFATTAARQEHDDDLGGVVGKVLLERPAAEWEAATSAAGVACVKVFEGTQSEFTCTEPSLLSSGLTVEVDHPLFGRIIRHGPPVAIAGVAADPQPSALFAEDTGAVLSELGLDEQDIARLAATGVVALGVGSGRRP